MARVVVDADVLIAFLDAADPQHSVAVTLLGQHLVASDELLMSASVFAEILVRPLQTGTDETVEEFITASGIRIVAVDREVARTAAALRAQQTSLRLPDAMCLAVATREHANLLTLDKRLARIAARRS